MVDVYPLPIILVGIDVPYLSELRSELTQAGAEIEAEFPSPVAALECLRKSKERARLTILQLGEGCDDTEVERLAGYFIGWPIMALLPGNGSLEVIQRIYRAGARQLVQVPLNSEDFHRALRQIALQVDRVSSNRQVLAVAGVTGGCGATTLAINLAYEIAHHFQRSTVLAELTLQVGALPPMLDVHPTITLPYLLREIHRVDDLLIEKALIPYGEGLRILSGAEHAGHVPPTELAHVSRIIDGLKKLADVTVLDVPGTFNDADLGVLHAADHVILVGLQNVPSIRALKLFCEAFPEERLNHSLWITINRYNPTLRGYTCAELKELLGLADIVHVANDYKAAIRAINQGQPLRKVAPETPVLRDLDGLIKALFGLEQPAKQRKRLFDRVVNVLNL